MDGEGRYPKHSIKGRNLLSLWNVKKKLSPAYQSRDSSVIRPSPPNLAVLHLSMPAVHDGHARDRCAYQVVGKLGSTLALLGYIRMQHIELDGYIASIQPTM